MGWTGLLVEPNPDVFAQLVNKKRRAHIFGHCLSTKTTPGVNFINILRAALAHVEPKGVKKILKLTVFLRFWDLWA